MSEHIHQRVSSFGDPYCATCGADLDLQGTYGKLPYTPKQGDMLMDEWMVPANGAPPFRITLSNNNYDQLRKALDKE